MNGVVILKKRFIRVQLIYNVGWLVSGVQQIESVIQFSCSVMSNSLQPHGLQRARLPYPSRSPGACLNSCTSSQ